MERTCSGKYLHRYRHHRDRCRLLDGFLESVTSELKKGGKVTLVGFGTFATGKRAARTGRNPRTGATIKIPAAKTAKFTAGAALKKSINNKK